MIQKEFNAKEVAEELVKWVRNWFDKNCPNAKAVIGISGGKDSTVCAGILKEAIGSKRIVGVLMPNGVQKDINDSLRVCEHLDIVPVVINIEDAVQGIYSKLESEGFAIRSLCSINTPPRIRMTTLYAVAGCVDCGGIVVNTSNLSESYVGYFTKNADNRGDIAPLLNLTKTEVVAIGHELGLPKDLVDKVPSDGLCGKTDENNLGFSYDDLDRYLRGGEIDSDVKVLIEKKNLQTEHKRTDMPTFNPF
jgi:NAD+ synthase